MSNKINNLATVIKEAEERGDLHYSDYPVKEPEAYQGFVCVGASKGQLFVYINSIYENEDTEAYMENAAKCIRGIRNYQRDATKVNSCSDELMHYEEFLFGEDSEYYLIELGATAPFDIRLNDVPMFYNL